MNTNRLRVLEYVRRTIHSQGIPPTIEEIATGLNLSKSTVHKHIVDLENDGELLRKGSRRLLTLVRP